MISNSLHLSVVQLQNDRHLQSTALKDGPQTMICLLRRISNPCHFPPTGNVVGSDQFPPPLPRH